jgi:hypothetical protein
MRDLDDGSAAARAIAHVAAAADGPPLDRRLRVNLHFHPDRLVGGLLILAAMARDGVYRSQFETGTSNGGLSAHPGGDRWEWEARLFGGAYGHARAEERPKYGSLNFHGRSTGGSPRFGSAHFRLTRATLDRTTFCYPDSAIGPTCVGVAQKMSLISVAEANEPDLLDDYIEAHVHGRLRIPEDVEALVLDPCFRGTDIDAVAGRLGCAIEWHEGFRLSVDELRQHSDYRGQEYVDLGVDIARGGVLDARAIGDAARSGCYPEQSLKKVWHCLARFGAPTGSA